MANGPFSSLSRRERFQAYLIVVLIIAAVLVFAGTIGIILSVRSQVSNANSATKQNPGVSAAPWNDENNLNPPTIWDSRTNGASPGATPPLAEPTVSETNAN